MISTSQILNVLRVVTNFKHSVTFEMSSWDCITLRVSILSAEEFSSLQVMCSVYSLSASISSIDGVVLFRLRSTKLDEE